MIDRDELMADARAYAARVGRLIAGESAKAEEDGGPEEWPGERALEAIDSARRVLRGSD